MKQFQKLFILATALLFSQLSHAQQFYYSDKKKIYLTEDTSTLIIKAAHRTGQIELARQLRNYNLQSIDTTNKQGLIQVKKGKAGREEVIKQIRELKDVLYAWHSLKVDQTPLVPTGEILLQPKKGVEITAILSVAKAQKVLAVKKTNKYGVVTLLVNNDKDLFNIVNTIYESGLVEWAHPNFVAPIIPATDDPLFNDQWHLRNTGQFGGTAGIDINVENAWAITDGEPAIRVAVLDDGVQAHDDFRFGRLTSGYTPILGGGNGAPWPNGAHGQACAGIIGMEHNNSIGGAGVAPGCTIVPINMITGTETAAHGADAINWAWDEGAADVLSCSWSYGGAGMDVITAAINNARTNGRGGLGSIVVFASGNDGSAVSFPGNVNGVITVGALANTGSILGYSNTGASMDLVAPSGSSVSSNLTLTNPLNGIRTMDRPGTNGYTNGDYVSFNGTSASCPQVAGVAALMLSANPNLTEAQVRSILQTTATDMGATGFDNTFGYGRVNGCNALLGALNVSFTGVNSFCNGSTTYQVLNLPANVPVTWSITPAGVATLTTNGHSATLTRVDNGVVTLTASFACRTYTKNIIVGAPVVYSGSYTWSPNYPYGSSMGLAEEGSGLNTVCFTRPVTSVSTTMDIRGASNATWNGLVPPGVTWSQGGNNLSITFKALNQIGEFVLTATNSCGTTNKYYTFQTINCAQQRIASNAITLAEEQVKLSPNPANDQVTVTITKSSLQIASHEQADNTITLVKVYDVLGRLRKQQRINNRPSATINTSDLTNGIYFVEITNGQHTVRKNLHINR
jgi:serine protease